MRNYFNMLNESFEKLYEEDDDSFELLDGEEGEIELQDVDIKQHRSVVVQDDNWEVYIPRSTEYFLTLVGGERAKYSPGYIYYIFRNKKQAGDDYIFSAKYKNFGHISSVDSRGRPPYDNQGKNFIDFIVTKTSDKIKNWVMKKFPNTFGEKVEAAVKSKEVLTELNYTYNYPQDSQRINQTRWYIRQEVVKGFKKIIVAEGTEELGSYAFNDFLAVTEVILPKSLKVIGRYAFQSCKNLKEIKLPKGITTIKENAFYSSGITKINLPSSLKVLGSSCFSYTSLEDIKIPKNITEIPASFYYSAGKNLKEKPYDIFIPNNISVIHQEAFGYCSDINIYIPKSVTTLGPNVFYNGTNVNVYCEAESRPTGWDKSNLEPNYLGRIANFHWGEYRPAGPLDEDIEDIEDDFEVLPDDVDLEVIDFNNFSAEATKVFSDSSWDIWKPKSEIGLVVLSQGTKWLGGYRWRASERAYDEIDEESWNIKNWAYAYIIINKQKPEKKFLFQGGWGGLYSASFARYGCASWVLKQNSSAMINWFKEQDFVYVSKRLKEVEASKRVKETLTYNYPADGPINWEARQTVKQVVIAPDSPRINARSFYNFREITSIDIPESVKNIGNSAFYNCKKLKEIKLPSNLKKLGNYALSSCESIEKVVIPQGVTDIGEGAFYNCVNLTKVYIPNSVKKIGGGIFSGWLYNVDGGGKHVTIYCEAKEKPEGWSEEWLRYRTGRVFRDVTIEWGATMPAAK